MRRQRLDPQRTTWHITFGTYGTRLHGGVRITVERNRNRRGDPFVGADPQRRGAERDRMRFKPVWLTDEQRRFLEAVVPEICKRGGWGFRTASAGGDHVHLLVDVLPEIHGERVRRLIKRWLGQALSRRWPLGDSPARVSTARPTWWAEQGSNKPVKDVEYLNAAYGYIRNQHTTQD